MAEKRCGAANQMEKAEQFRALHVPGKPLILFNVWDAGSAKAVAAGGAKAIATSSWSVANANGFTDGETSRSYWPSTICAALSARQICRLRSISKVATATHPKLSETRSLWRWTRVRQGAT